MDFVFYPKWFNKKAGRNFTIPLIGVGIILLNRNNKCPGANFAQELYELSRKKAPRPMGKYLSDKEWRIETEIKGHEIEVQVAKALCDRDEEEKRLFEARSLSKYDDFKGMRVVDIKKRMRGIRQEAIEWVDDHWVEICSQHAYAGGHFLGGNNDGW